MRALKKALFLGTEDKGYWVAEVAASFGYELEYTGYIVSTSDLIDKALRKPYDYIIIDISGLLIGGPQLKFAVEQVVTGSTARVCVLAQDMAGGSVAVQACISAGVQNICNSLYVGELRRELEYLFRNEPNVSMIDTSTNGKQAVIERKPLSLVNVPRKTIGVAGSMRRIGTTTQALQIVKCLQMQGKNTAYIEVNDSHYLKDLVNMCAEAHFVDEALGFITYQNIDMFNNVKQLERIYQMGYEYFVFDFGAMNSQGFQELLFYEKDYKITVHGSKPSELVAFDGAIKKLYSRNVSYVFSFVPENEQEEIKEMMDDRKSNTYFAPFTPNPYSYSSESPYLEILGFEEKPQIEEEPVKKRGLFGRKKRKAAMS